MAEKKRQRAKIKPKNFGAGRPQTEFPEVMRPAVVALTLNGGTVDDCRDFLKKGGFNIARASILAVMATASNSAPAAPKPVVELALDGPHYDDVRGVLDDFVREKRTAKRVRSWLQMAGYDPPDEQDVADYMAQRELDLAAFGDDPAALDLERLRQHARGLRAKAAEVWRRMPNEEKYSQRVYLGLASELAAAEKQLADAQQKKLAAGAADEAGALAEIARKLGVALDPPDAAPTPEPVPTETSAGTPPESSAAAPTAEPRSANRVHAQPGRAS